VDSNFATENWDEDDDDVADSKQSGNRTNSKQIANNASGRAEAKQGGPPVGVRPDSDWLNQDFDD
jgi:hypothetical protein